MFVSKISGVSKWRYFPATTIIDNAVLGPVYMEASFPASRVSRQGEIINCQCLRVAGKLGQTGFNSGMLT